MKRLALLTVFVALVAGAAFAQPDMGNTAVAGATYTTGIVQALDASSITIKEDSSRVVTMLIVNGTVGAENHLVGSRVRVDFHNNDSNQIVADVIQGVHGELKAETVVAAPVVKTMPAPAPAAEPTYTPKTVYTPEPTPTPATWVEPAPSLPRGASPLATIGLLGLIALGGALALRFKS